MAPKRIARGSSSTGATTEVPDQQVDEMMLDEPTLALCAQLSNLNISLGASSTDDLTTVAERMKEVAIAVVKAQKKVEQEVRDRKNKAKTEKTAKAKEETKRQNTIEREEKKSTTILVVVSFNHAGREYSVKITIAGGLCFSDLAISLLAFINDILKKTGEKKLAKSWSKKFVPVFDGKEVHPRKTLYGAEVINNSRVHFRFPDEMRRLLHLPTSTPDDEMPNFENEPDHMDTSDDEDEQNEDEQ